MFFIYYNFQEALVRYIRRNEKFLVEFFRFYSISQQSKSWLNITYLQCCFHYIVRVCATQQMQLERKNYGTWIRKQSQQTKVNTICWLNSSCFVAYIFFERDNTGISLPATFYSNVNTLKHVLKEE